MLSLTMRVQEVENFYDAKTDTRQARVKLTTDLVALTATGHQPQAVLKISMTLDQAELVKRLWTVKVSVNQIEPGPPEPLGNPLTSLEGDAWGLQGMGQR